MVFVIKWFNYVYRDLNYLVSYFISSFPDKMVALTVVGTLLAIALVVVAMLAVHVRRYGLAEFITLWLIFLTKLHTVFQKLLNISQLYHLSVNIDPYKHVYKS